MVNIPKSLKNHDRFAAFFDACHCEFCEKERGDEKK